jgi:hypothetical protein
MIRCIAVVAVLGFVTAARAAPATVPVDPPPLKPNLKWQTLAEYEAQIGGPGVLLQNDFVWLFAPKTKSAEAKAVFDVLARAYDELYAIVGRHTKYKIVVVHLPAGWGGTSECVIEYDHSNLGLDKFEEWTKHKVPHVSGYIEEMAHNFVSATGAQFGWEMVGWSLGVNVCRKVADNPVVQKQVAETRKTQSQTYARFRALNCTFPADLEANVCDRIHAHLLWLCEQRYGPRFWPDVFERIRAERAALEAAASLGDADAIRNERYRITVDCFDRLEGVNFKRLLTANQISTTVDVKSLHPTEAGWDRKFVLPKRKEP